MVEKPDFITNFIKPENTEIKHIGKYWYLYECKSTYVPSLGRSKKVSGKILGSITENGFTKSNIRKKESKIILSDVVEEGASVFLYSRTEEIRKKLKIFFPEIWDKIYIIVLLRIIYDSRFRRIQLHYENCILSHIFKNVSFTSQGIANFLKTLGKFRNKICSYMREDLNCYDKFIIFDGHRILSNSRTMENAEKGYDSKMRFKPQINLLYMFSLGRNTGYPVYYKQFIGSTPDVTAFQDILSESSAKGKDCTIIADKGFSSGAGFELLESVNLKYIIPLKRGNVYIKDRIPLSPSEYESVFSYNSRAIHSITFHENDFDIHLYFDASLFSEEISDLVLRTEKKNNTIDIAKKRKLKMGNNGKGMLTSDELKHLIPATIKDMYQDKLEMGTITIKTNRTDLNPAQIYCIYKQRQIIEQFFKTYEETLAYEASYMRSNLTEEAWLFLNHLSAKISIDIIEEIASIDESKRISFKDLIATLKKIHIVKNAEKWEVPPVKKKTKLLCDKLGFDFQNLSELPL